MVAYREDIVGSIEEQWCQTKGEQVDYCEKEWSQCEQPEEEGVD